MIVLEANAIGQIVLRGPGAGRRPTASAVFVRILAIFARAGMTVSLNQEGDERSLGHRSACRNAPARSFCAWGCWTNPAALAKSWPAVLGEGRLKQSTAMRQTANTGRRSRPRSDRVRLLNASRTALDRAAGRDGGIPRCTGK